VLVVHPHADHERLLILYLSACDPDRGDDDLIRET